MSGATVNFEVSPGDTFAQVFRWATGPYITKAITGITRAAPTVVTAVGHGVVAGWPVAVASAGGMVEINASRYPPRGTDWHPATILSADTVELNDVDSTLFTAYTSGGFLVYPTPVTLTGMTATFKVYDNPSHTGTPLVSLTQLAGITLDNTAKTITITFPTASVTWNVGYYELVLTDTSGVVKELAEGTITLQ